MLAGACSKDPERSINAFCGQVKQVTSLDEVLHSGDSARIRGQLDEMRTLQQVAPAEIEPKLGLVTSFANEYASTLGTAKDPDDALNEVSVRRGADLQTVVDAATAVKAYAFDNCKVTLGTNVPGTGTTIAGTDGSVTTTVIKAASTTTASGKKGVSTTTVAPKH